MSRILLIETASEVCSVAIAVDGRVVAHVEDLQAPSHAALLTLQIEACSAAAGLTLASIDAIALSSGPGAYTSLRVGSSVAKGICYALGKPLIAVDTLLALACGAQQWYHQTYQDTDQVVYAPALDARRQEIWTALYSADLQLLAPARPIVLEDNLFENFIFPGVPDNKPIRAILSGNGVEKVLSGLSTEKAVLFSPIRCSAIHLAMMAEQLFQNIDFQDIAYFEPFYMKPPNITTPNNAIIGHKNSFITI
jgi:tRNA threonylcarbamoyladenosine biosynthesis protein TsaB